MGLSASIVCLSSEISGQILLPLQLGSLFTIMTTPEKPDQLSLNFPITDTQNSISRSTLKKLAEHLGFTRETQVIHYALRKLAKEVLLAYEADEGELTRAQLTAIRKATPQGRAKSVKSNLF